jgi:hypothetical protein
VEKHNLLGGGTQSCGCYRSAYLSKVRKIDITGKKFGRLTVIELVGVSPHRKALWRCKCDCGNFSIVVISNLLNGTTKSCGCMNRDQIIGRSYKHGLSDSHEYSVYLGMLSRCYNKNNTEYKNYGGRGIKVCDRWRESFLNFFGDMGECPNRYTIDRINNDGDYEPENCRWIDTLRQANNKRTNRYLTYKGEAHTVADWARILGVGYWLLSDRLNKLGWSVEEALSAPAGVKR